MNFVVFRASAPEMLLSWVISYAMVWVVLCSAGATSNRLPRSRMSFTNVSFYLLTVSISSTPDGNIAALANSFYAAAVPFGSQVLTSGVALSVRLNRSLEI